MRGVAAVEFGLILPLLILLIFGIAEFGRMLYQYNALVKSVRDGARFLSVYSSSDTTNYPTHLTEAKCIVVYGNKTCAGDKLVSGLNTTNVTVSQPTIGTIKMVTVTVTGFNLGYITGYLPAILNVPNPLSFGDISNTMRQTES